MTDTTNTTETTYTLKFQFNGFKLNGALWLAYLWLYLDSSKSPERGSDPHVAVSVKNYEHLPRDLFKQLRATNHSDYQSDYCDNDRFEIRPGSPWWPSAKAAAIKAMERMIEQQLRRLPKTSGYGRSNLEGDIASNRAKLAEFRATSEV